jgi:hypothetical protein
LRQVVLVDDHFEEAESIGMRRESGECVVEFAEGAGLRGDGFDRLTERPEVADVRTSIVYEHLTNKHISPAHGIG